MTDIRDAHDPNVDTFDHLGARDHGAPSPAFPGIHEAGPLAATGIQLCRRCQRILIDYRGAMIPIDSPPLTGWAIGAHVEIDNGNPRSSWLTEAPATCDLRLGPPS